MVEGEQQRAQRFECPPAPLAAKVGAVSPEPLSDHQDLAGAFGFLERHFDGLDQPVSVIRPEDESIQHDLDARFASLREHGLLVEIQEFLTTSQPGKSSLQE